LINFEMSEGKAEKKLKLKRIFNELGLWVLIGEFLIQINFKIRFFFPIKILCFA